jgi:hypothetical protein
LRTAHVLDERMATLGMSCECFISLAVVLVAGWLCYRQAGDSASVGGAQPTRT